MGSTCVRRGQAKRGGALAEIIGERTGQQDTEEDWLLVQKDVQHPTRPDKLPVKVAYSLKRTNEGKFIQPLRRSLLTVHFPTAKETGLAFLIHGPFASTPARDNIQSDSEWNDLLLSEIASLVADSLEVCKNHGFLKADFLACLPIDAETFPSGSTFRPIYDAVQRALIQRPLIPTVEGDHAPAIALLLGRSHDLRNLLPPILLQELLGLESTPRGWVDAAITENRFRKVWQYLRDECGVRVIDGETFARQVTTRFLDARQEEWMIRFYSYLRGQEALWRSKGIRNYPPEGPLRKKAIIRCDDAQHRKPFDEFGRPAVFLPVVSDTECHIVSRAIYRHEKAAEFFHRLGLVAPDICTQVLNAILPAYRNDREIGDSEHAKHVETIRKALLLKDSPRHKEMIRALKDTKWVLGRNAASGEQHYNEPTSLFFPSPKLRLFFEGNDEVWFLAEHDKGIDWPTLGLRDQPIVHCRGLEGARCEYVTLHWEWGWHKRGWDGFDPETSIDGLQHALKTITPEKAAYIWNELLPPLIRFLHGRYQTATHKNYDNASTYEEDSRLCKTLKAHAWIPVGDADFMRPDQCTVADMAGGLRRNDDLAQVLGMERDPQEVAKEIIENQETLVTRAGFSPEVAALLIHNRDRLTPEIVIRMISNSVTDIESPEFPERPVPNRDRRVHGVRNRSRRADPKTYDNRKRSVRTSAPQVSPKVWLREMYTNPQGVTVCQICCKAMPFKLPTTGEYYFEAVQFADNFAKEDHCLYLALCPLCAAKYTVLVKKNHSRLSEFIWAVEQADTDDLAVLIQLEEGTASVRFVESHLLDLQTVLNECLS